MKLSRKTLQTIVAPPLQESFAAMARDSARTTIKAVNPAAMVDNSTGVAAGALVAVPTQNARVPQSGANLASRAAFNTAIGKVDNAIAVLASYFGATGTALELTAFTGATGNVAAAGTVAALDKNVGAGVDGSAGGAMLRIEMNNAIVRQRNNLATILRKYNGMAVALGVATLTNNVGGSAHSKFVLGGVVTATTAVGAGSVASGDLATKAAADAALTALANDIATLVSKINTVLFAAGTLNGRVPVALVA